jgi:hypothetical protein
VEESFRGFQAMLVDDEQVLSIEAYLLALVRAVRSDERDEEQSKRDVYVGARKRRRRLGLISFGAGATGRSREPGCRSLLRGRNDLRRRGSSQSESER